MINPSNLRKVLFCFLFVTLIFTCKKTGDNIPYAYVNFDIYIHDPEYYELQIVNGYVYVKGGYNNNGIIIYRKSETEFSAFDMTCPYDPQIGRVLVDEDWGILATDSVCGSQFLLNIEVVSKGPASRFLKKYNTSFNEATGMLYVFN